jgi:hypothetical protein
MFNQINRKTFFARPKCPESILAERIREFDNFTVTPRRVIGYLNGEEVDVPCSPKRANYWRVAGHYKEKSSRFGFEDIKDFRTQEEAQRYRDQLQRQLSLTK